MDGLYERLFKPKSDRNERQGNKNIESEKGETMNEAIVIRAGKSKARQEQMAKFKTKATKNGKRMTDLIFDFMNNYNKEN